MLQPRIGSNNAARAVTVNPAILYFTGVSTLLFKCLFSRFSDWNASRLAGHPRCHAGIQRVPTQRLDQNAFQIVSGYFCLSSKGKLISNYFRLGTGGFSFLCITTKSSVFRDFAGSFTSDNRAHPASIRTLLSESRRRVVPSGNRTLKSRLQLSFRQFSSVT